METRKTGRGEDLWRGMQGKREREKEGPIKTQTGSLEVEREFILDQVC